MGNWVPYIYFAYIYDVQCHFKTTLLKFSMVVGEYGGATNGHVSR